MKKLTTFVLLPLLLAVSCTSDFSGIEVLEFDTLTVTANKTVVNGLEIIEINIQNLENPEAQYAATFGDESVTMVQATDSSYALIVPDLPTGTYDFVADVAPDQSLEFQVTETTLISTPEQTVMGVLAYPTSIIDDLEASTDSLIAQGLLPPAAKNGLQEITNDFNQAISDFQNAPQEEKEFTAKFLKANSQLLQAMQDAILELEESIPLVGGLSPRGGACMDKASDAETMQCLSDELDEKTRNFLLGAAGILTVGAAANLIPGVGPEISKVILIGGPILLLIKYHENLLEILKRTFVVFENLIVSDANAGEPVSINQSYSIQVRIPKRNVQPGDISSPYPWIGAMVTDFDEFKSIWDKARQIPVLEGELYEISFPDQIVENKPPETLDFLRVEILEGAGDITGRLSGTPEELFIRFNREENSEVDRFKYKITYDNGVFDSESEVMTGIVEIEEMEDMEDPSEENTLVYNNTNYTIKDGGIEDYGAFPPLDNGITSHYNFDFYIFDADFTIVTEGEDIYWEAPPDATFGFYAELFSPGIGGFQTGAFQFMDLSNANQSSINGKYFFDYADVYIDSRGFFDENGEERDNFQVEQEVVGGTITVSGSGLNYTLNVDVTLQNGQRLQGSCSLTFEYIDER